MRTALEALKSQIATFPTVTTISDSQWEDVRQKTTVFLMAGGEGQRFSAVAQGKEVNKNSFALPNGDTMIEMCIRMYKEAGVTDFVALLYHKAETIEQLLGDGSNLEVKIKYSYDPGKPVGKGGAVKHALEQDLVPEGNYFIVHNPDDVVLDYPGNFPKDIMSAHIQAEAKGALCSVVVVEETPHQFSAMKVSNGLVDQIEMYPMLPLPTHIGVTILSPAVKSQFLELFSYDKKEDFEKKLFPILSQNKQLYASKIPTTCWIPVNNPKTFQDLLKRLNLV